eukprot:758493-Prorocentrum_minimum.AAC.3
MAHSIRLSCNLSSLQVRASRTQRRAEPLPKCVPVTEATGLNTAGRSSTVGMRGSAIGPHASHKLRANASRMGRGDVQKMHAIAESSPPVEAEIPDAGDALCNGIENWRVPMSSSISVRWGLMLVEEHGHSSGIRVQALSCVFHIPSTFILRAHVDQSGELFWVLTGERFEAFKAKAAGSNLIPLFERIFSDQLTPVMAYGCLVKEDDRKAPSFLLESVVNGDQSVRNFAPHCISVGYMPL